MTLYSDALHKTIIYILVFLFALHITPAVYINSSFLGQYVDIDQVGLIYSGASLLAIILFFFIRKVLDRIGNYKTILLVISVELVTLLVLAFVEIPIVLISAYIIGSAMRVLAMFNIDIFLESVTADEDTGGTRGIFLTSLNTAFMIGPFIAGMILTDHDFWKIYAFSSVLLIPVLFIIVKYMKGFKDPEYEKPEFFKPIRKIYDRCNLFGIFVSTFLLQFFFIWMVVYTPIYLNQYIGFSLSEISIIIGIALIPFVLLEVFLGWIADKLMGEKEILTTGFIITAGATATMAFITLPNVWLWAAVLFTTRIGASMIEVMTESYLFKKIDSDDINILSFFRMMKSISYIIAPIVASLLLMVVDFKFLFLILGSVMLYGIRYSLAIEDTL